MMKLLNQQKIFLLFSLASCNMTNYYNIPLYSDGHRMQAVIEIPAGSNHFIEYCGLTHRFEIKTEQLSKEIIRTLPFPYNVGFIPSTAIHEEIDASGSAIDVIILASALPTGRVIEILPLGVISYQYMDRLRHQVVAIPYTKKERIIDAESFREINEKYPDILQIIEKWICYSDPAGTIEIKSWQDEIIARKLIETWAIN